MFMLVMRFVCCCGRRGARLAPIHVALDEEAEELVELLQGWMIFCNPEHLFGRERVSV